MSVSLMRTDPQTKETKEMPISFQRIWNEIWEKAIEDRGLKLIGTCTILHKKDMAEILREFQQVKEYVMTYDIPEKDKEYVIERIDNITDHLEEFWNEVPGIDELDMG